jgi:hypothetical protein
MNSLSASRMPKTSLNSTPSRGEDHKNFFLAESITGKATPITSLILLRILHVATSSEGRNRCCFASSCSSRFRAYISRSSLSCFLSADSSALSRSTAADIVGESSEGRTIPFSINSVSVRCTSSRYVFIDFARGGGVLGPYFSR